MKISLRIALAAVALAASTLAPAQTLLNASYDVAREFYKDYNAAFIAHYQKATGKTIKEIAAGFSLSEKTIATYRARISEKLRLSTNVELTRYALQHKLVE